MEWEEKSKFDEENFICMVIYKRGLDPGSFRRHAMTRRWAIETAKPTAHLFLPCRDWGISWSCSPKSIFLGPRSNLVVLAGSQLVLDGYRAEVDIGELLLGYHNVMNIHRRLDDGLHSWHDAPNDTFHQRKKEPNTEKVKCHSGPQPADISTTLRHWVKPPV